MQRRDVISGVLCLSVAPTATLAQLPRLSRKIGYLHPRTIGPTHAALVILKKAWQQLGYVEGETVLLRSAEGDARRLAALVAELVSLGVGVLIVLGPAAVRAASKATLTTPIVAVDFETDPVRAGYAATLGRPGGNVTGLFVDQPSIAGKWIDLLREVAPDIVRLAILWDANAGTAQLEVAQAAAKEKGMEPVVLEVTTMKNFDEALRPLSGTPRTGIVQLSVSGFNQTATAASFATAAQKYRLPTITFLKSWMFSGALMSYGLVEEVYLPRAVVLADKILNGEKPGALPIEGPDRFEFVINMKTAKAMGLTIPQSLLLRADQVIQ